MIRNSDRRDSQFADFANFENINVDKKRGRGTVLKSSSVISSGARKVQAPLGCVESPEVILHRNGNVIESIEFVCKCGKRTEVVLEYDGD